MDREIYQPAHFGFTQMGGNGFCKSKRAAWEKNRVGTRRRSSSTLESQIGYDAKFGARRLAPHRRKMVKRKVGLGCRD